jgi:hypothetical protein
MCPTGAFIAHMERGCGECRRYWMSGIYCADNNTEGVDWEAVRQYLNAENRSFLPVSWGDE